MNDADVCDVHCTVVHRYLKMSFISYHTQTIIVGVSRDYTSSHTVGRDPNQQLNECFSEIFLPKRHSRQSCSYGHVFRLEFLYQRRHSTPAPSMSAAERKWKQMRAFAETGNNRSHTREKNVRRRI